MWFKNEIIWLSFLKFFYVFVYKMTDLKKMTLRELKAFARTKKIKGYSKYTKKADLLNFLSNFSNPPAISELKDLVSQMKVGGSVLEYQSKKKQTRKEKRDKKNLFILSMKICPKLIKKRDSSV